MASLMDNLLSILEQEDAEYRTLLEISREKSKVIVQGDVTALQKITDEEQSIIDRIYNLDLKREEYTKDIANVINKDVESLTIEKLITMLGKSQKEQERLSIVFDRLKEVVGQMRTVNAQNKELLEGALELVEFDLNLLHSMRSAPQSANYNSGAYNTGSPLGLGAGGFDARQ